MRTDHGGSLAQYKHKFGGEWLDFSANISPLGVPARVLHEAQKAIEKADQYPDAECYALRKAIAADTGIPAEQIVCGNGAADLIYRIPRIFRGKKALLPVPAFSEYEAALTEADCKAELFFLKEELGFCLPWDFPVYLRQNLDLLILCQPNNPTGIPIEPALLKKLLLCCQEKDITLVVDECFLDFLDEPKRYSLQEELKKTEKLILLRAFTKSYGMAGLRLGYALCSNPGMSERLQQCAPPWAVSNVAQAAGIAALSEKQYLSSLRKLVAEERERLIPELKKLGFKVIPGKANFLLFYSPDAFLGKKLEQKKILIRDCSSFPGLQEGWFRTAIRKREENELLLQAMREAMR